MSQKKTKFPGQDNGSYAPRNPRQSGYEPTQDYYNFGKRSGTVFGSMAGEQSPRRNYEQINRPVSGKKPIIGFLYSVSRTASGEYWPLHFGQNVIGSSPECDIVLREATVSQKHAILHINKMKNPEKVEATISDCQSTNGTMVNGNSVSVARPPECVDGDIITIGENYVLLFILIDLEATGLKTSDKFIELDNEDEFDSHIDNFQTVGERVTRNQQDFPPRFDGPVTQGGSYHSDETVGIDPTSKTRPTRGGTIGMDD